MWRKARPLNHLCVCALCIYMSLRACVRVCVRARARVRERVGVCMWVRVCMCVCVCTVPQQQPWGRICDQFDWPDIAALGPGT